MDNLTCIENGTVKVLGGISSNGKTVVLEVNELACNRIVRDCYSVIPQASYIGDTPYYGKMAKSKHLFMRFVVPTVLVDTFVRFIDYLLY